MKKILLIIILISYSVVSLGISVNYFYCCDKLKTISLAVNTEVKDNKTESKKGCCDNRTVIIKLKTDQKNGEQAAFDLDAPLSLAILHTHDYNVANIAIDGLINSLYKRPPPLNLPSRNILFCVFRI